MWILARPISQHVGQILILSICSFYSNLRIILTYLREVETTLPSERCIVHILIIMLLYALRYTLSYLFAKWCIT
jgi:hypothetical protein